MAAQSNLAPPESSLSIHLHPTADLAERVLLPGDPGRALRLAQALLDSPVMFNHHRGLWGYTGTAPDGRPLTIQSTGMGGPSAAIVIFELAELGARRILRVGTCGALDAALALGELLVVTEALPYDGTSAALGARGAVAPDSGLLASLLESAPAGVARGGVVSTDLFYDVPAGREQEWVREGARAVEMETATLFALASRHDLRAGSILAVSDLLSPSRLRIGAAELEAAELRLGQVAVAALLG
jgi:uridine phosphorylase